ncbi:MAG: GAF domain-containing protein [Anaerolineales bacterium]|nr:GAF domain-containing protein [Anaerolineales bacterium]
MDQQNPELTQRLLEIARDLVSNLELSELLPTILDHLARVVSYASSSIMLIDGEYLRPVAQRSVFNTHAAPMTVRIDELAHVRAVVESRRPLIIGDTQHDPRWKQRSNTSFIRCWLGVPLVVKDQVIGLFNLSHGTPNYYGPKDVEPHSPLAPMQQWPLRTHASMHGHSTKSPSGFKPSGHWPTNGKCWRGVWPSRRPTSVLQTKNWRVLRATRMNSLRP